MTANDASVDKLRLRFAKTRDVGQILQVIDDANHLFDGLELADESLGVPFPAEKLNELIEKGSVWVFATRGEELVAGVIVISVSERTA